MTKPNILALDLSFHCSGWAALSDGAIESGTQSFEPTRRPRGCKEPKPLPALRFARFHAWLIYTLELQQSNRVIIERAHLRGWAATLCGIGMLAIVQMECALRGIEPELVHTATLKKYATGYGKADKAAMIDAARKRWDFYTGENDEGGDEADSLLLLAYALEKEELSL